jgi:hypothetical protein
MTKIILAIAIVASLSGCVSQAERASNQAAMNESVPVCETTKQCDVAWSAATTWVTEHCAMKLQTVTDSLLQTYNSPPDSPQISCRVLKERGPTGRSAIRINVGCANIFGCVPSSVDSVLAFGSFVKAAMTPYAPLKLGVNLEQVTKAGIETSIISESYGVKVLSVVVGQRADGKLTPGDVVTAIGPDRVRSVEGFADALAKHGTGETITVSVIRGGNSMDVPVEL